MRAPGVAFLPDSMETVRLTCNSSHSWANSVCSTNFRARPRVSGVTTLTTTRPPGWSRFSTTSRMSARLPPLPPTNTRSGSGKSCRAPGASPKTVLTPKPPSRCEFSLIISNLPFSLSTAYTLKPGAILTASIPTEPEPAPTSHMTASSLTWSSARIRARASFLVIRDFSFRNRSSSRPNLIVPCCSSSG